MIYSENYSLFTGNILEPGKTLKGIYKDYRKTSSRFKVLGSSSRGCINLNQFGRTGI